MPDVFHRFNHAHKHKSAHKLSMDLRQLHDLTLSHHHHIEQWIAQELSQNPAIEVIEEPAFLEDLEPQERDDDWNENFAKPEDEYETGESSLSNSSAVWDPYDIASSLEQAAIKRFLENPERLEQALRSIDYYRIHGYLPEDSDTQLQEALIELEESLPSPTVPSFHPTFEVSVEDGRLRAYVIPVGLNLRYSPGLGRHSDRAHKFIQLLSDRNRLMNDLAHHVLETLQRDFFFQSNLDAASRHLIPVPVRMVSRFPIKTPFKLDKRYLSKLGDLLVLCSLGTFPVNHFLQDKAALVRVWAQFARDQGISAQREQLNWIKTQIEAWISRWDSSDIRHEFIESLRNLTIEDIKYSGRPLR